MTMFWLKTQARWRERHDLYVSVEDRGVLVAPAQRDMDDWLQEHAVDAHIVDESAETDAERDGDETEAEA